jgi:hypothetical protein
MIEFKFGPRTIEEHVKSMGSDLIRLRTYLHSYGIDDETMRTVLYNFHKRLESGEIFERSKFDNEVRDECEKIIRERFLGFINKKQGLLRRIWQSTIELFA